MIINDCYIPLLDDTTRHLVIYGGAGSGKSRFVAQKIIRRMISETGHRFLALRKVGRTVKRSIFQELKDVLTDEGISNEFQINVSDFTFTHTLTGNQIFCTGLDEPEKIKSISGITSMWIEEATEFAEEDVEQLNLRIRGAKINYVQFIYTFNPIDADHWLKKRFIDNKSGTIKNVKFVKTTYKDNAFLTIEDVEQLENLKHTNKLYYQVYCLGDWGVVDKTNKFLYNFEAQYHVGSTQIDKNIPLRLSFDFNINPFSCIVFQQDEEHFEVLEEIRLNNSDIYQMCDFIRAKYPPTYHFYIATGDRTGYNQTGVVRGKTSYWAIIKKELNLADSQLNLRSRNLDLVESRVLCNAALKQKDIIINPACETLIRDCKYAVVDDKGVLVKDRQKNMNDFLDCFRYALDSVYPQLTRKPQKQ